ncbi:MAG: ABC transporter permease [Terricaulis sp.]|nr:ABC transporter permease [Terricaulis sp.]
MMRTSDLVASAGRALRANPMRSALTALGVIIGVASVVAMVALGSGAQAQVERFDRQPWLKSADRGAEPYAHGQCARANRHGLGFAHHRGRRSAERD